MGLTIHPGANLIVPVATDRKRLVPLISCRSRVAPAIAEIRPKEPAAPVALHAGIIWILRQTNGPAVSRMAMKVRPGIN